MSMRRSIMIPVLAVALAACSQPPRPAKSGGQRPVPPTSTGATQGDLLVVGSGTSVTTIDPRSGVRLFTGTGVTALADWSQLLTADITGTGTVVRASDTMTGQVQAHVTVSGTEAIRAVSSDAELVALMAPLPSGVSPWTPQSREFTDVVVADPWGRFGGVRRFHLEGNLEPEAFSSDDASLFMIEYLPPAAPTAYRVLRLDLNEGEVYPGFGRNKTPSERMSAER